MKLKLYKNKIILLIIFIFILFAISLNIKEGYKSKSSCRNCTYYDQSTRRCKSYCGENLVCSWGSCACARGYQWMRTKCDRCPNGQYWNGSSCVCPSGQNWNGSSCITCKQGQTWQNNQCECKGHQRLKADGSVCIDVCEKSSLWNGSQCVCPEGKKWVVARKDSESGCK